MLAVISLQHELPADIACTIAAKDIDRGHIMIAIEFNLLNVKISLLRSMAFKKLFSRKLIEPDRSSSIFALAFKFDTRFASLKINHQVVSWAAPRAFVLINSEPDLVVEMILRVGQTTRQRR